MPEISTIGNLLYWSYANLAMAVTAVKNQATTYNRLHFMIRSKLFKGLQCKTMNVGSLVDDERLKLILPQACNYCGSRQFLSIDHLIPKNLGGKDKGENIVWACRACNSSKSDNDVLEWLAKKGQFPSLYLLRRYLKILIEICQEREVMECSLLTPPLLPFSINAIPSNFPQPAELKLWIVPIE